MNHRFAYASAFVACLFTISAASSAIAQGKKRYMSNFGGVGKITAIDADAGTVKIKAEVEEYYEYDEDANKPERERRVRTETKSRVVTARIKADTRVTKVESGLSSASLKIGDTVSASEGHNEFPSGYPRSIIQEMKVASLSPFITLETGDAAPLGTKTRLFVPFTWFITSLQGTNRSETRQTIGTLDVRTWNFPKNGTNVSIRLNEPYVKLLKFTRSTPIKLSNLSVGQTINFISAGPDKTNIVEVRDFTVLVGEQVQPSNN